MGWVECEGGAQLLEGERVLTALEVEEAKGRGEVGVLGGVPAEKIK